MRAIAVLFFVAVMVATTAGGEPGNRETATFAGGCFWCMEPAFDRVPGVISVTVGYTGGFRKNPTYEEVSAGTTGHAEAIRIAYDPRKISYRQLLDRFWRNIDPLARDHQFCDVGSQYRSAIFYHTEEQKRLAEETKRALERERGWRIMTEVVPAGPFYEAEEYHRAYYRKNPLRYKFYRSGCGRDRRLEELWGKRG